MDEKGKKKKEEKKKKSLSASVSIRRIYEAVEKRKAKHPLSLAFLSAAKAVWGQTWTSFFFCPPWTFLLRSSVAMVYVLGHYDIFHHLGTPFQVFCLSSAKRPRKERAMADDWVRWRARHLQAVATVPSTKKKRKGLICLVPASPLKLPV
jgi:hypothetical protein